MVVGYHHFRKPPFGDIPKNGEHEYEYDMCISCVCILYMSYGRNYLFGENMGKCHHQMWRVPYRFCGFGIWIMENRFRGPPIDYEGSLHRFKVQGNFFLLCSSTNFVSYSYEISTSSWLSDVEQLKGVRLAEPATKTTIGQSEMCWDVISLGPLKILNQSDQSVS